MRPNIIAGILLLGLAAFVLLGGTSPTSRQDGLGMGAVRVTQKAPHTIPSWMGWAAMVLGLVVIVAPAPAPTGGADLDSCRRID